MGFFAKLGKSLGGALQNGLRAGVQKGIQQGLKAAALQDGEGVSYSYYKQSLEIPKNIQTLKTTPQRFFGSEDDDLSNPGMLGSNMKKLSSVSNVNRTFVTKDIAYRDSDKMNIDVPDWGYDDFINSRAIFQKGIHSPFSIHGFFYFKVFFKFDTQHGLLGGIMNNGLSNVKMSAKPTKLGVLDTWEYDIEELDGGGAVASINSAVKYLHTINKSKRYKMSQPDERMKALIKFTKMLSHISSKEPWFIKSIKGLSQADSIKLEDMSKEKIIELGMGMEAVDMRLTTMFDLYRYATHDMMNCREVIPDNLRKFEMQVVVFNVPLKNFHQALKTNEGNFGYKRLAGDDRMSYKIYTFQNCEFDLESFGSGMPDLDTEKPGELGHHTIKIKYDRVYTTTSSEFYNMMLAPTGFLSVNEVKNIQRISAISNAVVNNQFNNDDGDKSKDIIGASEAFAQNALAEATNSTLMGNIYSEDAAPGSPIKEYNNGDTFASIRVGNGKYYKNKLKFLKTRGMGSTAMTEGFNILINKILGGRGTVITSLGNIYESIGSNRNYFYDKLKNLKRGTLYSGYTWDSTSEADLRSQQHERFSGNLFRINNKNGTNNVFLDQHPRERRHDAENTERIAHKVADTKKGWQNEIVGIPGTNATTMDVSERQHNMAESVKDGSQTIGDVRETNKITRAEKMTTMTESVKKGNSDLLSTVEADHAAYKAKMEQMSESVKRGNGDITANVQADHKKYLDELQEMSESVKKGNGDLLSTVEADHKAYKDKVSTMAENVKKGNGDITANVQADHKKYLDELQQMTENVKRGNGDLLSTVEADHKAYKAKMSNMAESVKRGNGDLLSTVESDHAAYLKELQEMAESVKRGNGDLLSTVEADHKAYLKELQEMSESVKRGNGDLLSTVDADHKAYKTKMEQMTENVKRGNGDITANVQANHKKYLDELQEMSESVKKGNGDLLSTVEADHAVYKAKMEQMATNIKQGASSITSEASPDAISERGNLKAKLEALKKGTL